jgi:tRNA (guanine37-N1)-methyltransferase
VLTVFPDMFGSFLNTSILGRAAEKGILNVTCADIRSYSRTKHRNTDDYPFGGGAGMVMTAPPIAEAMKAAVKEGFTGRRLFLGPRGQTLTQQKARELAGEENLVLLCGHYEGVDQRVLDRYTDEELSVGDYILTGGEPAAMVLIDCVARLLPGVLGCEQSAEDESFSNGLLEYPHYTRPRVFEGIPAPETLLNGHHADIARWKHREALLVTARRRPDLLAAFPLTEEDRAILREGYPCSSKN